MLKEIESVCSYFYMSLYFLVFDHSRLYQEVLILDFLGSSFQNQLRLLSHTPCLHHPVHWLSRDPNPLHRHQFCKYFMLHVLF